MFDNECNYMSYYISDRILGYIIDTTVLLFTNGIPDYVLYDFNTRCYYRYDINLRGIDTFELSDFYVCGDPEYESDNKRTRLDEEANREKIKFGYNNLEINNMLVTIETLQRCLEETYNFDFKHDSGKPELFRQFESIEHLNDTIVIHKLIELVRTENDDGLTRIIYLNYPFVFTKLNSNSFLPNFINSI